MNAQTGGCTQPHARAESFQRIRLADDFAEDKRWGYPKWKVLLGRLTGKGRKS